VEEEAVAGLGEENTTRTSSDEVDEVDEVEDPVEDNRPIGPPRLLTPSSQKEVDPMTTCNIYCRNWMASHMELIMT
jgi:hypothetical protein